MNEVKINVLFVDASIWRNSVPTVSSLFKYYCRCMKSFGFLEMRSGAVIASNGLSEWKNRSDTKKTTCPLFFPQRHYSCRTQHLGLTPLPFKISSLQISRGAAHAGFITQRQRHQRQPALWSLGGLQLTASVYKSLSDKSRLLDRHFTGGAFRCDRKQSICQIILLISRHIRLKKLLSWGFMNDAINWKTEVIRVLSKVEQMRQSAELSDLDYNWNKRLNNKQSAQSLALELLATLATLSISGGSISASN